jgi:hypothetical protein
MPSIVSLLNCADKAPAPAVVCDREDYILVPVSMIVG